MTQPVTPGGTAAQPDAAGVQPAADGPAQEPARGAEAAAAADEAAPGGRPRADPLRQPPGGGGDAAGIGQH
ncbi:hypothetical protein FV225_20000, partial [Methylobacterium sp. WL93]